MINGKKVCVIMPAYNAEKTLKKTYDEIPKDIVDDVILTDDASQDETVKLSQELDIKTFVHTGNKGYGGNQKTCYQEALKVVPTLLSCCIQTINITPNSSYLWHP